MKIKKNALLNVFVSLVLIVILYFGCLYLTVKSTPTPLTNVQFKKLEDILPRDCNIWLIFTKVTNKSSLNIKFGELLQNLLNTSSIPLKFHIIVDEKSKNIASNKLSEVVYKTNRSITYSFYDFDECASKIGDIVSTMTPFFSSKPGTYYSDALFYISLGLYRIAPVTQDTAILLDCDLYFKKDIALLFEEFKRFKPTALFGLAPELTPVYRHILHMYKLKHRTTFGEFYHDSIISSKEAHPKGFQGYNSGVVLVKLKELRQSKEFSKLIAKSKIRNLTESYRFRGHLGDQDFYTLIGYEYPHLIQTLNCGFNRQLCTWWRDHGYHEIFDHYFKCEHPTVVLHGNCNTKIPKEITF
ncbi:xyloside xylosyltransferase 1 [Cylas formicarius]|uniref:xyloside xylosyltransferase 1 n=1 Tax=Cylas formicarius TaxID=197179 RepID=UPI002958DBA9|nr:xyloside xylosyltransferase 1 [Cylas formicarius]